MAQNELDDIAVIDQCETSSDLSVDNECGFFMLDHDGDIQTTVEQCRYIADLFHSCILFMCFSRSLVPFRLLNTNWMMPSNPRLVLVF